MKVRCVRETIRPERRLTHGRIYDVLNSFTISENVDDKIHEIQYVQIIDNIGDLMNYAMKYGDEVWFENIQKIRDDKIDIILSKK